MKQGTLGLEPFSVDHFVCARDLLDEYAHLGGFGIADASNVLPAERHGTRDILTTDQRDFREIKLPCFAHACAAGVQVIFIIL